VRRDEGEEEGEGEGEGEEEEDGEGREEGEEEGEEGREEEVEEEGRGRESRSILEEERDDFKRISWRPAPTARMAAWGGLMTAIKWLIPYIPRFDTLFKKYINNQIKTKGGG
jgi:hypothetical protein